MWKIIDIEKTAIDRFTDQWPCHGVPKNVDHIMMLTHNGDLVDLDLYDINDKVMPLDCYQGEGGGALGALTEDAEENAKQVPTVLLFKSSVVVGYIYE
jgi:hypothetical protein